jgi:hypothetical protein
MFSGYSLESFTNFLTVTATTAIYNAIPYKGRAMITSFLFNGIKVFTYLQLKFQQAVTVFQDMFITSHSFEENIYVIIKNEKVPFYQVPVNKEGKFEADLVLYESDKYNLTMKSDNIQRIPIKEQDVAELIKESKSYFISFVVSYENKPPDQPPISIGFKTDKINYFMSGNHIDKYVIWFLTKQQHSLDNYGVPYIAQIMDNNVKLPKVSSEDVIVFQDDAYTITPLNDN